MLLQLLLLCFFSVLLCLFSQSSYVSCKKAKVRKEEREGEREREIESEEIHCWVVREAGRERERQSRCICLLQFLCIVFFLFFFICFDTLWAAAAACRVVFAVCAAYAYVCVRGLVCVCVYVRVCLVAHLYGGLNTTPPQRLREQ